MWWRGSRDTSPNRIPPQNVTSGVQQALPVSSTLRGPNAYHTLTKILTFIGNIYYNIIQIIFIICVFLAVLGLCCWAGFSLVSVLQLLTAVASLVPEHRLQSSGSVVVTHQLSCSEGWGIKLESPALAGGFLCTGPPGKSLSLSLSSWNLLGSSLFP